MELFNKVDEGNKGYLTQQETYKLFVLIHKVLIKSKEKDEDTAKENDEAEEIFGDLNDDQNKEEQKSDESSNLLKSDKLSV